MISCHDLTVGPPGRDVPLYDEASFEVERGGWSEFVGPSGVGKSVLRSIVALERRALEGQVVVGGRAVERLDESEIAKLRRRIGCCRQPPEFLEERTALENLVVPLLVRGQTEDARERAEDHLASVGAESLGEREMARLSDGERWLVGVLRATIGNPDLVVVDGVFDASSGRLSVVAREVLEASHEDETTVVVFGRNATDRPGEQTIYEIDGGTIRCTAS